MKITVTGHKGLIGSKVLLKLRMMALYPYGVDVGDSLKKSDCIIHCAARLDDSDEMFKNNIGITGGRVFIAEHFDKQDDLYSYFFFEDDMEF